MSDVCAAEHPVEVLVVDDQALIRLAMKCVLEGVGASVLVAADGEEALQQLARHPSCELMVTDRQMPGVNGDMLLRHIAGEDVTELRGYERPQLRRIVCATASPDEELAAVVSRVQASGVDCSFFKKPIGADALVALLHE